MGRGYGWGVYALGKFVCERKTTTGYTYDKQDDEHKETLSK